MYSEFSMVGGGPGSTSQKVKSGLMVEIGLTNESKLLGLTGLGLVRLGGLSDRMRMALKHICFGSRTFSDTRTPLTRTRCFF